MKRFVRFFSLCTLFTILCCMSFILIGCTDEAPKIEGNYVDAANNFYQITKKDDGKYAIMRVTQIGRHITNFENFLEIDSKQHYCWVADEPLINSSDAPKNSTYKIEIYIFTNESTGENFWYVLDGTMYDTEYYKQTNLTPTQMTFNEWQYDGIK